MKKQIANIITVGRIIFSLPILFIPISSAWFYVLYLFCGISDMIDGTIARKTGTNDEFGAKLDTFADLVFLLVCSVKVLPLIHIPLWLRAWISTLTFIKIFNIALVLIRKKKLLSVHSVLNKITGFALFLLPLLLSFVEIIYSISAICLLATIAAVQEVYFVAKGQEML